MYHHRVAVLFKKIYLFRTLYYNKEIGVQKCITKHGLKLITNQVQALFIHGRLSSTALTQGPSKSYLIDRKTKG